MNNPWLLRFAVAMCVLVTVSLLVARTVRAVTCDPCRISDRGTSEPSFTPLPSDPNVTPTPSAVAYVDRYGTFGATGKVGTLCHVVEAGICEVGAGDTAQIGRDSYNELVTIDKPVALISSEGPMMTGQVAGKAHTTLKVLTYNTHLFGSLLLGILPTLADEERARQIGDRIREESADIVGLQEVWDGDLADIILAHAGYPYSFYGNDRQALAGDVLHSGLLLLSKYPIVDPKQIFYQDEEQCGLLDPQGDPLLEILNRITMIVDLGCDGWASKGFLRATVIKDGFPLGIFVTHTDAGGTLDDYTVRGEQFEQLKMAWWQYLQQDPTAEVIVLGDLNEADSDDNRLRYWSAMRDAFRNAPCFDEKYQFTDTSENDLAYWFNSNERNRRVDYILYSQSDGTYVSRFDIVPTFAEVRTNYLASPPITIINQSDPTSFVTVNNLSDHYGLVAEFALHR